MKIVYSEKHAQHDPQHFVVRGTKQRSAEQLRRTKGDGQQHQQSASGMGLQEYLAKAIEQGTKALQGVGWQR